MLAYMMLNVITNEYITSVSKTKHSKLKESPVAGPRIHTWNQPTDSHRQLIDGMDVRSLWTRFRRQDRSRTATGDIVRKHGDGANRKSLAGGK